MSTPPPNPYAPPTQADPAHPQAEARRRRNRTIWLVAVAIALVFTGVMLGVVMSQFGGERGEDLAATETPEAADTGDADSGAAEDEPQTGEPEATASFSWPKNLATGGIIFTGNGTADIDVVRSAAPAAETAPAPRDAADLGEKALVHLYLDYRCPYCALFDETNNQTLTSVVESGEAAVEVHTLTFLDRIDEADAYSSRAAGAVTCVASEQPEAAWAAHLALGSPQFQPSESTPKGHDNAAITAEIDRVAKLDDETKACIAENRFVSFTKTLSDWWFANPVPDTTDVKVSGTPFIVVNGTPYAGAPDDAAAFRSFLEEQGIKVP